MAFAVGDWVEFVRDVRGASRGHRGKVTSTGFLGGLDIHLENGDRVRGVDPSAVVASSPSNPNATTGPNRSSSWLLILVGLLLIAVVVFWVGWGR